jgi:hypothetical protein
MRTSLQVTNEEIRDTQAVRALLSRKWWLTLYYSRNSRLGRPVACPVLTVREDLPTDYQLGLPPTQHSHSIVSHHAFLRIHQDELLTIPVPHLRVRKSALVLCTIPTELCAH